MNATDKILVAGATGLAGSAIVRALLTGGFSNIVATYNKTEPASRFKPGTAPENKCRFIHIDLLDQQAVNALFEAERPGYVFLAAAKVGGIMANHNFRAEFIYENLQIQNNVIHNSYLSKVKKLIFLGSTCIYPSNSPQPMKESYLMTSPLEYLSEPYGVAKIAGIKMCESYSIQYATNYIAVMPTNLYGPNDNYDLKTSHFLPAFIRKMHLAKCLEDKNWEAIRNDFHKNPVEGIDGSATLQQITGTLNKYGIWAAENSGKVNIVLWGSGKPRREILHSDELADACLYIMQHINFTDLIKDAPVQYSMGVVKEELRNTQVNIGLGYDYSLQEIALQVKEVVGFKGDITWNPNMPDGTMQKLTDTSRLSKLGWHSRLSLVDGLAETYRSYVNG